MKAKCFRGKSAHRLLARKTCGMTFGLIHAIEVARLDPKPLNVRATGLKRAEGYRAPRHHPLAPPFSGLVFAGRTKFDCIDTQQEAMKPGASLIPSWLDGLAAQPWVRSAYTTFPSSLATSGVAKDNPNCFPMMCVLLGTFDKSRGTRPIEPLHAHRSSLPVLAPQLFP